MKKIITALIFIAIFLFAQNAKAAVLGEAVNFNIEPSYDLSARTSLTATLRKVSPSLYFYMDDSWWTSLAADKQASILDSLTVLGEEFDSKIYPNITQVLGEEWRPGIDRDTRITILIHPMRDKVGGYWNVADEYPKSQIANSNERELIYLNSGNIDTGAAKIELAHELQHMISFNQKTRLRGAVEDVWLNEARSEYAVTLAGYDSVYEGSNLQQRVRNFLDKPYDSLTEWQNAPADYGVANLFVQYLVDHYGKDILARSMFSQKTGISSINAALGELGFTENFTQVFTDWLIASYINDCNLGQNYCYLNPNLKNFRVVPLTNFIPITGQSTLSIVNSTKDWAGNWFKFVGGRATLKIDFSGQAKDKFKVPYIVNDASGGISIDSLDINASGKGQILIPDFGSKTISIIIIPNVGNKVANFTSQDPSYQFSWTASTIEKEIPTPIPTISPSPTPTQNPVVEGLLLQIANLQKAIEQLRAQLAALSGDHSCSKFEEDLYLGSPQDSAIRCLQEFLKNKGAGIYPEGIVSGNFLNLTFQAVKRYQALKGISQTGYFGPLTRTAVNSELGF